MGRDAFKSRHKRKLNSRVLNTTTQCTTRRVYVCFRVLLSIRNTERHLVERCRLKRSNLEYNYQ